MPYSFFLVNLSGASSMKFLKEHLDLDYRVN